MTKKNRTTNGSRVRMSFEERLWKRIRIDPSGCWLWTGSVLDSGYAQLRRPGHGPYVGAHVAAYEICVGDVPPGMFVCHTCDHPLCVYPRHLFIGTHDDNVQDAVAKGRHAHGESHPMAKLTETEIQAIRDTYSAGGVTQRSLAELYGVHQKTIHRIVCRKGWKLCE